VIIPAVEAGLQRGALVMQPADSQFTRRGGLTTFNILFKNKEDQFRTGA
jgi:hypothetical protein